MDYDFTIVFICGGGYEYFSKILKNNVDIICSNTIEPFDLVLLLDGIDNYDCFPYIKLAQKLNFNEIILRSRKSNCATGDPSNNGHIHTFSTKTKYLITFESDVAIFKTDSQFDILHQIRKTFENNQNLCVLTKIDDYDCWQEKLSFFDEDLDVGIRSINRVSSHFLVYNTKKCEEVCGNMKNYINSFYDSKTKWFNYEDLISKQFAYPNGPGIGFLESFPIKVFHCDEKLYPGSAFYKKDTKTKIRVFESRKEEVYNIT